MTPMIDAFHIPEAVVATASILQVPARSGLADIGIPADAWCGVRSGLVELVHEHGRGRATLVDLLEPGQWTGGDTALHAATVLPSTLLVVTRERMGPLMDRLPAVREWLLAATAQRTRRIAERLHAIASLDGEERVRWAVDLMAGRLVQGPALCPVDAVDAVEEALTQGQLARVAGTSRQTVNKVIAGMRRREAALLARPAPGVWPGL